MKTLNRALALVALGSAKPMREKSLGQTLVKR